MYFSKSKLKNVSDGCIASETCLTAPYEVARESFSEKYCLSVILWSEQDEMTCTPLYTTISNNLVIFQISHPKRPHHAPIARMPLHTSCSNCLEKVSPEKVVPVSCYESNNDAENQNRHLASKYS